MITTIHTYYGNVLPSGGYTFYDASVDEVIRGVTFEGGCTHVKASLEVAGKLFVCKKPVAGSDCVSALVSAIGDAASLSRVHEGV